MVQQVNPKSVMMALIKRELLEHRSLFVSWPILGTATVMVLYVYAFVNGAVSGESRFLPVGPGFLDAPERIRTIQISSMYGLPVAALMFSYWLTMAHYFLTTLQQQRQNRSILFWNSMPVSDTQTVLSKLITGLLCCHALYIACCIVMVLFLMLLSWGYGLYAGIGWDVMVAPARLPALLAGLVFSLPLFGLWALPVYGWFLLVSARMQRLPLVWAAVPVVFVVVAEFFVGSRPNPFTLSVPQKMVSWMAEAVLAHGLPFSRLDVSPLSGNLFFASPMFPWVELGVGALLGAFFVFAAIRLNRSDEA